MSVTTVDKWDPPASIEEGYAQVCDMIMGQAYSFVRRTGEDFEEVLSEANELFVTGHIQYDGGLTNKKRVIMWDYKTQIHLCIWYGLYDKMRNGNNRRKIAQFVPLEGHDRATKDGDFNAGEFVEELSTDAKLCAEMVLNPPVGLMQTVYEKGGTPRNYRSTIRAYLRTMGWSAERVSMAFDEIKTALG